MRSCINLLITKNAQGCQLGILQFLKIDYQYYSNILKYLSYTQLPGSAKFPGSATGLLLLIHTRDKARLSIYRYAAGC